MAYQMLEFQKDNLTQPTKQTEMVVESSEVNENQLDQNFFQDNKDIPKKGKKVRKAKTPYSATKTKARNCLSNLAYRRICDKDLLNASFIIDMLCYICMDLKPFFLNTTYSEQESRDMIKILWEECLPKGFYELIKKPENFELLNSERLTFKHVKNMSNCLMCGVKWQAMFLSIIVITNMYTHCFSLGVIYNVTNTGRKAELNLLCLSINDSKEK